MKQGSLPEHSLTAAVFRNLGKQDAAIWVGAAVGNDYANVEGIITADGVGEKPLIAWHKAVNNFLCSGGQILGARITMILPKETKESAIKSAMEEFRRMSDESGISIVGGHTQITKNVTLPNYCVNVFGKEGAYIPDKKRICAGFDIVMVGFAGRLGANYLLEQHFEQYRERLSESFLEGAKTVGEEFSILPAVSKILEAGMDRAANICYMHDISCGGVYAALWQLGKWMDRGFVVQNTKIGIKQETVEICEVFDVNPYLCDGTGGLLIVCENGRLLCERLGKDNLRAAVIGKVTDRKENKEKIVCFGEDDRRTLAPADGDERFVKDR